MTKLGSQNIIRTSQTFYAIKNNTIKNIAKEICHGNYISFLNCCTFSSYEMTLIFGYILNNIKDFFILKKYLEIYLDHLDCWALCDILKFKTKYFENELFELAKIFCKDERIFTRRVGLKILFSYTKSQSYTNQIFEILNSFYDEKEYYVNMIVSWIFCEMFIFQRKECLEFLQSHHLNKFSINKGIQKCRDSFRVTPEDKEMLLRFKEI